MRSQQIPNSNLNEKKNILVERGAMTSSYDQKSFLLRSLPGSMIMLFIFSFLFCVCDGVQPAFLVMISTAKPGEVFKLFFWLSHAFPESSILLIIKCWFMADGRVSSSQSCTSKASSSVSADISCSSSSLLHYWKRAWIFLFIYFIRKLAFFSSDKLLSREEFHRFHWSNIFVK